MKNKIRNANSDLILNASDIGKHVDHGKSFLKGGTTALWNAIVDQTDSETIHE